MRVKLQFQQQIKMVESYLLNLYFDDSDSNGKFEGSDTEFNEYLWNEMKLFDCK